jgi:hypothetical protein
MELTGKVVEVEMLWVTVFSLVKVLGIVGQGLIVGQDLIVFLGWLELTIGIMMRDEQRVKCLSDCGQERGVN